MQARRRNRVGRRVGGWAWEEVPYVIGNSIVLFVLFYILFVLFYILFVLFYILFVLFYIYYLFYSIYYLFYSIFVRVCVVGCDLYFLLDNSIG